MRQMFDASNPPIQNPPDPSKVQIAGGYIGGNTPHVWTDQEWNLLPQKLRLPIYACSHPENHDPNVEADKAIKWLDDHNVPVGVVVALDLETAVDPSFVRAFDSRIVKSGRLLVIYGSKSTIFDNPLVSGGYWVANWTGIPILLSRSIITQYASDTMLRVGYDLNVVDNSVQFWQIGDPVMSIDQAFIHDEDDRVIHYLDHGDDTDGSKNHHKQIRSDIAGLSTRLAVVEAGVQAGIPVNLTDAQLLVLANEIAISLAEKGIKLSGTGTFSGPITLGADA